MLHGVNICSETLDESKMLAAFGRCLFLSPKKKKQQDVLYSKNQPVSQVTGGDWRSNPESVRNPLVMGCCHI